MAKTQADFRRDINPRDQFGRKWQMSIELATGYPTGGVFQAGWMDPLRTPMKYVQMVKNEDNQVELGRVHVDFQRWIADHEAAEESWIQQLHINARDTYKRLDRADVQNLEDDKFLIDLTGPKPWPSPEVLKLAAAGDKALLGLAPLTARERVLLKMPTMEDIKSGATVPTPTSTTNDALTPPDNYQQFVSWVFRSGTVQPGDLRSAASLWQEHRKNLAATT